MLRVGIEHVLELNAPHKDHAQHRGPVLRHRVVRVCCARNSQPVCLTLKRKSFFMGGIDHSLELNAKHRILNNGRGGEVKSLISKSGLNTLNVKLWIRIKPFLTGSG